MVDAQYKLDAVKIADIYNAEGEVSANEEFQKLALNLPFWAKLALKDEVIKLIKKR